jgi:predicted Zn-dependent peptidase
MCMKKHVSLVLDVVEDIIKNAEFPEHELEIFKNKHKQQFLVEQSKVRNIARYVHSQLLFGNHHPYGYAVVESDFDRIDRESILKFYKQRYQAKNCQIIVSGKADDEVIRHVESRFGADNWNYQGTVYNPTFTSSVSNERQLYVEKSEALQSAVRIGKVMFNKLHDDFVGLSVLNCVLGGYFGSRLMKKIREEKGYTYGINSLLVEFRNSGYFAIVSELGADVTSPAIDDIYSEINKLRNDLVPADELSRVKNYMLGDVVRMFDGPFAQAESLISLLEYDLGYDYFHWFLQSVRGVSDAVPRADCFGLKGSVRRPSP